MTQKIPQDIVQHMKDIFIGTKIEFEDIHGERFVGVCEFIGYNPFFPTWDFQVTVDRRPVPHVKVSTIKHFEGRKAMFEGKA